MKAQWVILEKVQASPTEKIKSLPLSNILVHSITRSRFPPLDGVGKMMLEKYMKF
jgi:hypothetical protein